MLSSGNDQSPWKACSSSGFSAGVMGVSRGCAIPFNRNEKSARGSSRQAAWRIKTGEFSILVVQPGCTFHDGQGITDQLHDVFHILTMK